MKKTLLSTICILALNVGFNAQANATALNDDCPGDIVTYYLDNDGDGFGNPSNAIEGCSTEGAPLGYVADNTDCNDQLASVWVLGYLWADADADGYTVGTPIEACFGDFIADGFYPYPTGEDCNDNDISVYQSIDLFADLDGDGITGGLQAVCYGEVVPEGYSIGPNGLDCNDFNAAVSSVSTWYLDADADNYFTEEVQSCDAPGAGYVQFSTFLGDCNDANPFAYQSATLFIDNDLDGYTNGMGLVCFGASIPSNRPISTLGEDCNDDDASIYPEATEICDGQDNNCDGQVDEGFAQVVYFADADGDGFGGSASISSCSQPSGYVTVGGDCNDASSAINPSATEICDGLDNNCDGSIDEGVLSTFYADADADGFGSSTTTQACSQPSGYVSNSSDCNDESAAVNPSATEICDGIDNNCDGTVDEGSGSNVFYADADGDGFGDAQSSVSTCVQPVGYVTNSSDCNDNSSVSFPNATEIADNLDNNCDGTIDEGFTRLDDASCGIVLTSLNSPISAIAVAGANNYRYTFENEELGFSRTYTRNSSSNSMTPRSVQGLLLGSYTYTVKVAARVGNVWRPYGFGCTVTTPEIPRPTISAAQCGIEVNSLNDIINLTEAVPNAQVYRFKLVNTATNEELIYTKTNNNPRFRMRRVAGVEYSATYLVSAAARVGEVFGNYGAACEISSPNLQPQIASAFCGTTVALASNLSLASSIAGAQAYQYELVPTNGGATLTRTRNGGNITTQLEDLVGIQDATTYSIRVKVKLFDIWSNFGPACTVSTPAAPAPQLASNKCGKTIKLNSNIGLQSAIPYATNYEYKVVRVSNGEELSYVSNSSSTNFRLNQVVGLVGGTTYNISVRAFRLGAWTSFGSECSINASTSNRLDDEMEEGTSTELTATVYPNPFQNAIHVQMNLENQEASIRIIDLTGRVVLETKTAKTELELGEGLNKGMYFISIVAGDFKKVMTVVKE